MYDSSKHLKNSSSKVAWNWLIYSGVWLAQAATMQGTLKYKLSWAGQQVRQKSWLSPNSNMNFYCPWMVKTSCSLCKENCGTVKKNTPVACLEMNLSGKQNDGYDMLLLQSRDQLQYLEEGRTGRNKLSQSYYLLGCWNLLNAPGSSPSWSWPKRGRKCSHSGTKINNISNVELLFLTFLPSPLLIASLLLSNRSLAPWSPAQLWVADQKDKKQLFK